MSGVLHCDTKPANISRDTKDKVVYLLDFGHAQKQIGASAHEGTLGYEAPETLGENPAPHSCITDAYSVVCTLLDVLDKLNAPNCKKVHHLLRTIAGKLSDPLPSKRIMLSNALQLLETKPLTKSLSLTN
jgi:serine/threonine protein kinase